MTALAAHASAALDLLDLGIKDSSVLKGLDDAELFCDFIERGVSTRRSEHFSAAGLAADDYSTLVFSMPGGEAMTQQLPTIKAKLLKLRHQLNTADVETQIVEELRAYFFHVAEKLPVYEGIHDKLMASIPKRV